MQRIKLIFVLTAVLVGLAACTSEDGGDAASEDAATETESETTEATEPEATDTPTTEPGGAAAGGETTLDASGNAWQPTTLSLEAGAPVSLTVTNSDSALHSFTFEDAQVDEDIQGGETATIDFTAPAAGEYTFICKYHSSMQGTVTVA